MRSFDASRGLAQDRFGFAWAPKTADNSAWTTDYVNQSATLLDRLAAAIRASAATPDAACTGWCTAAVSGASFVETWKTFQTWSYPALGFSSAPATAPSGAASAPITVQLQQAGVAQTSATPVTVALASSSPTATFAPSPDGPWTSTLSLDIPAGSPAVSFYYRDTAAGAATVTAGAEGRQSASQTETVQAGPLAAMTVSPANASIVLGSSATFTASGADAYGNAVAATPAWSASSGTVSSASGASTTFTPASAGTATITASANGVAASATVTVTARTAGVSSIVYSRDSGYLYVTISTVPGATVGLRVNRYAPVFTNLTATTRSGTITVRVQAPRGCYTSTVTSLTASGYVWDGATPSNGRCF
jgi:hypothetical protein